MTGAVGTPAIRLATARSLIGASFDLLGQATEEMRRASFYVGAIAVGTVAPLALASWAIEVRTVHLTVQQGIELAEGPAAGWQFLMLAPAIIGLLVAFVESRILAAAILGGRMVGRPLTMDQALARSRMVFWRSLGAAILAGIPLAIAQGFFQTLVDLLLPLGDEGTVIALVLAAVLVGAPFAYVLSGVVLGDVGAGEAVARSFRVYRARKVSAAIVAVFESTAALLILLGLSAGLDLALRMFDGLGLGADAGPAGLILVTIGIVVAIFAFGTLILTVTAISIAPQVVMFVGLTHATIGVDHVRPGADHDPAVVRPGRPRFRVITRSMWAAIVVAWLALGFVVLVVARF